MPSRIRHLAVAQTGSFAARFGGPGIQILLL